MKIFTEKESSHPSKVNFIDDNDVFVGCDFDKDFFKEVDSCDDLDDGKMVIFRLVNKDKYDLYLHLFNCHNGYYGHGFEVRHGGEIVKSGCI